MEATFYVFPKKINSTKRPEFGTAYQIELKATVSILNPDLRIKTNFNPTGYNYCYLPYFGRYYWVRNWTYEDGMWTGSLAVDTLATYRDQIGSYTGYVLRSSADYDPAIVDTLYPTIAQATTKTIYADSTPFTDNINHPSKGFFVVGVHSTGYVSFGGTIFLAMSATTFSNLMDALLTDTNYLDISAEEISSNLTKALFNPIQYISNAFWIPCGNAAIGTPIENIPVGWWSLNGVGNAYVIQSVNDKQTFNFSVSTPHHPQHIDRGVYLDGSPYSEYTLYCPGFGEIHVPANLFVRQSTLYARLTVDFRTGETVLDLSFKNDFDTIIYSTSANIGVQVPIAQIATNVDELSSLGGLIQTAVGAAAGAVSAFFNGGDVVNGIASGAQQTTISSQSKGGVSAVAKYGITPYITGKFYEAVDDNNSDHGRPLCQRRQLSTLPGYLMLDSPDLELPATQQEVDSVKSFLTNGFFFE